MFHKCRCLAKGNGFDCCIPFTPRMRTNVRITVSAGRYFWQSPTVMDSNGAHTKKSLALRRVAQMCHMLRTGRSSTQPSPNSAGLNSAEVSTQQVPSQQSLDSAKSQLSKSHLSNAQLKPLQVYIALRGSGPSPHIFKKKLLAEGQCVKNPGEELGPSSLVSPFKFRVLFQSI